MQYFMFKTEPGTFSIEHLAREGTTVWDGVRNYQARNIIREACEGDTVFIYHSNTTIPGVVGEARIVRVAYPDPSAVNPESPYFDPSQRGEQRWSAVDVQYTCTYPQPIPLSTFRHDPVLSTLEVARKGTRLSISRVSSAGAERIRLLTNTSLVQQDLT